MFIAILLLSVALVLVYILQVPKEKKVLRPIKVRSTFKKF